MINLKNLAESLPTLAAINAEIARRNFLDFVTITKPNYLVNWHHALLANEYLQKFIDGDIQKLMVFMPPQHGKSELTSRRLPAYLLGKDPDLKIVGCSYSSTLAASFNRDVQRIIESDIYKLIFPKTFLNSRNVKSDARGGYLKNNDIFETVGHTGFYKSVGVGGSLTGTTVDIAIIDDPVKDAVEAYSATDQARKWEWYTNVLLTRLHNNSQQLITMTRWHKHDLCGQILKKMPEGWQVLKLEAIKKTNTNINDPREYGAALWPAKHSKDKIINIARANPATFDALYQCDPKPNKSRLYATGFNYGQTIKNITKKNLPLHYTVDFNTAPYMSGLIIQMEYIKDNFWRGFSEYWQVSVFDKLALKAPLNDAKSLGAELEKIYPEVQNGFFLYGDASGNNNTGISTKADTIKTKTLFSDLIDGLKILTRGAVIKRIPRSNPKYRSIGLGMVGRRVFLNELLSGNKPARLLISPKCTELIADLENCTQDANGKLAKPKDKHGIERRGHMLQALEYFICHPDALGYLAKIKK